MGSPAIARKNGKDRIYTRTQGKGGVLRYYADLRDLGGGQLALKAPGSSRATDDSDEARILLGKLLEDIKAGKMPPKTTRPKKRHGDETRLGAVAQRLIKDNPGDVTEKWQGDVERRLKCAQEWFGKERSLISIESAHVREWINKLTAEGFANGTIRHHLHALSSVYRYAHELGTVPTFVNPVSGLYRKPSARRNRKESQRADFLEIPDAARIFEAAKKLKRTRRNGLIEFVHPLVATFLLTGGRKAEVLGLTWRDIDFDLEMVTFAPNEWRGLKREWSERTVPLWPQLREILEAYRPANCSPSDLVFPSPRTAHSGREGMVNDLRKVMADLGKRSKVDLPGGVTIFRHTYATARLQTTDGGKQISLWTVAKELGHKNVSRVEDTYGHPSHYRPRGEAVEYRVDQE